MPIQLNPTEEPSMISHNRKTIARTLGTDHDPHKGEHWQARAACAGMDTELWYPVGNPGPNDPVWIDPRAVCATCPVQRDCLNEAMVWRDLWGMRAGYTPDQLASIRLRRGGVA